jgi:hypothetical protein
MILTGYSAMRRLPILTMLAALQCASPVQANDSTAEVGIGGLMLTESKDITMDSEDLFISQELVKVTYRFTNTSNKDIETLVAFPLPDLPQGREEDSGSWMEFGKDLEFKTLVDNVPAKLAIEQVAMANGVDVTDRLLKLKFPIAASYPEYDDAVKAMSDAEKDALVKEGILAHDGDRMIGWSVKTTVTRKQLFPAGKTITVEHSYKPWAGGSVGGGLELPYRKDEWGETQKKKYCIEDSWYKSFDKKIAKAKADAKNEYVPYNEVWLSYILSSGANWKGPIKDFRLTVDKGKARNMISLCGDGVKKISDTKFEIRKKNFEPTADINILIIQFGPFE